MRLNRIKRCYKRHIARIGNDVSERSLKKIQKLTTNNVQFMHETLYKRAGQMMKGFLQSTGYKFNVRVIILQYCGRIYSIQRKIRRQVNNNYARTDILTALFNDYIQKQTYTAFSTGNTKLTTALKRITNDKISWVIQRYLKLSKSQFCEVFLKFREKVNALPRKELLGLKIRLTCLLKCPHSLYEPDSDILTTDKAKWGDELEDLIPCLDPDFKGSDEELLK